VKKSDDEDFSLEKMAPIVAASRKSSKGCMGKNEDDEKKKKKESAEKADLGEYWKKPTKKPETEAPTIDYSNNTVKRTPGSPSVEAGFKVPKEAKAPLKNPEFHTKLSEQRRAAGFKKSEMLGKMTSEDLTKSMLKKHQPREIEAMLRAGVEEGKLHRNVLLEYQNFGTVSTAVLGLASDEE